LFTSFVGTSLKIGLRADAVKLAAYASKAGAARFSVLRRCRQKSAFFLADATGGTLRATVLEIDFGAAVIAQAHHPPRLGRAQAREDGLVQRRAAGEPGEGLSSQIFS